MRHRYQSKKQPKGRFLANAIDDQARQKLAQLRMGL
jgi:DNA-binding TFAR19-related protein (PDSD5 family)